jgi:hypothetical protein
MRKRKTLLYCPQNDTSGIEAKSFEEFSAS